MFRRGYITKEKCSLILNLNTTSKAGECGRGSARTSLKHFFIASSKQEEGWEEIETVMQTWDVVEGLHNFGEFSQPSEC